MKLIFCIFIFNSLSALSKNKKAKEVECIHPILNNVNERLRLKFTSDENFRQFQLLKSDDSRENINLIQKFLIAAYKANTITKEEVDIFTEYIDHIEKFRELESERKEYYKESILGKMMLMSAKSREGVEEVSEDLDALKNIFELNRLKEERGILSSLFGWFWSFVGDKNKESVQQEERAEVRESMVQEEQVELRESELLAEEMEEVTTSSSGIVSLIKKK